MNFRPVKSIWAIAALVFLSLTSAIVSPLTAHADIFADWYISPGGVSEGYFSNNGVSDTNPANRQGCGFAACPVISNGNYTRESINGGYFRGGNASTAASVQRAYALVADLKAIYGNGGWDSAGAAFVVNTMLGYGSDDPSKTRTISPAMWQELENRLVDRAQRDRINWNVDFSSNGRDTFTRIINGQWDVVYNTTVETRNGILIYTDAGVEAYRIWYSCANPVGVVDGIPLVTPPTPYSLVPTITGSPAVIDNGGQDVTLVPTIRNGNSGTSKTANWETTKFVVAPGSTVPGAAINTINPKGYYKNGAQTVASGSGTFTPSSPSLIVPVQTIGDYIVGTKICFALSVAPHNQLSNDWRHSDPFCTVIAKKPKVQVLGGDLIVGRTTPYNPARVSQVATSTSFSSTTSRYYGSWSEYAIIPSGTVRGMASGAMYADGASGTNLCSLSVLTISNNTGAGCQAAAVGNYASGSTAPNIASRFPVTSNISGGAVDIKNLASARTYSINNATLDVSSSQSIGMNGTKGKWIVINDPDATVTITSNINYTNSNLASVDDIPQVVIIARNIIIAPGVTNVDAWLIAAGTGANGYINTCGSIPIGSPAGINSNNCNQPLTINGPVMANKLYMYRTAGSGINAATGSPAEVFNLRADAYLWASVYSSSTGRLPTVSTKELPPLF
jgi:hypothetical protein